MSGILKDKWNEFDWEAELKKDDERVALYMQELPRYIDLPSEDAVIMKHIQEKPGLIPADGDYSGTFLDNMFDSDEENAESDFSEDWQKRDGADFYIAASRLARLWAMYFASGSAPEITVRGMRVLCLYGKIMARSGELIDMDDEGFPALRIALTKRLLADLNSLMGEFLALAKEHPESASLADFHFDQLMTFRGKVLDLLKKYRSQK